MTAFPQTKIDCFHRADLSRFVLRRSLVIGCLAFGAVASALQSAWSQPKDFANTNGRVIAAKLQDALIDVIDRVEPSIVAISRAPDRSQRAASPFPSLERSGFIRRATDSYQPSGAGVLIDAKGQVLTQYLNIRPGDQHVVTTTDGRRWPATIRAADPRSGLAVLEIQASELPAIEIGDADDVKKGQIVVTLGNPQSIIAGGSPSASWGMITNVGQRANPSTNLNNTRDETGLTYATTLHHLGTLLQTDAKLNWSAGGGAVVDLSGKLIGVTTTAGTLPGHESPAGYAIPMTSVFRRVVGDLKAGREVEYGLLGLRLNGPDRYSSDDPEGALVSFTVPSGAASRAGIRPQDRLVEVDSQPVRTVSDLQLLVGSLPPGKSVTIGLIREGSRMELPVSLSKLHVAGEKVHTAPKKSWRGLQVDYSTALSPSDIEKAAQTSSIDPNGCVLVAAVAPNSAAALAGILPGTFISHVGDQRVSTPDEFYTAVDNYAAVDNNDQTVQLRFTSPAAGTVNRGARVEPPVEIDGD